MVFAALGVGEDVEKVYMSGVMFTDSVEGSSCKHLQCAVKFSSYVPGVGCLGRNEH